MIKQWKKWNRSAVIVNDAIQSSEQSTTDSFSLLSIMVSLKLYRQEIALLSKPEVIEEKKKLMKVIDRDAFFPLKL